MKKNVSITNSLKITLSIFASPPSFYLDSLASRSVMTDLSGNSFHVKFQMRMKELAYTMSESIPNFTSARKPDPQ